LFQGKRCGTKIIETNTYGSYSMDFGRTLASLRRRSRLSQFELAELSGVSQRHISFLESGRSNPGPAAVAKLVRALGLSFADSNLVYTCAGLSCPRPVFNFGSAEFATARRAIEKVLCSHAPSLGIATLRCGQIVMANTVFNATLHWAFEGRAPWREKMAGEGNLYDLTLHPKGLRQFMVNPDEIIPHTLRRLRAAALRDASANKALRRAEANYGLDAFSDIPETRFSAASSVLVERYTVRGRAFNLVSMVASFGSPEDVTAQALQIELFLADDLQTQKNLAAAR
jgi:transcriptional regulator with XRE-family HTH domain